MVSESVYSKANVTVSQAQGSKFRTIQSALDYAVSINRGDGRFIIYIKRGMYRVNVEIRFDLKNIMFLGDGLRYTIITGNRSVARGFTTYSTAIVGKISQFCKMDRTGFLNTPHEVQ
ncbi:putative pectinesterase [Helianthus anomalus]